MIDEDVHHAPHGGGISSHKIPEVNLHCYVEEPIDRKVSYYCGRGSFDNLGLR